MKVLLVILVSLALLFLLFRMLGLFKPQSKQSELKEKRNVSYYKDTEDVDIEDDQYIDSSFPLPFNKGDVWIITGEKVNLKETTINSLKKAFAAKRYSIQYYDKVFGNVTREALAYNFPGITSDVDILSKEWFTKTVIDGLDIDLAEDDVLFIRYCGKADPTSYDQSEREAFEVNMDSPTRLIDVTRNGRSGRFEVYTDSATNEEAFLEKVVSYIDTLKIISDNDIRFSVTGRDEKKDTPSTPDDIFDDCLEKVAKETYSSLEHLVMNGYSIDVIDGWLKRLSAPSRVIITKDYRIFLSDYNNMEITMTQLPKTVFLFFLWYDIRCNIIQLKSHRDEILAIYRKLSVFDEPQTMKNTIDRLVSSNGASFMEQCSAIKKAFITKISDRQAKHYYVHGKQGYSKGIDLDRKFVTWEEPLFPNRR